MRGQIPVSSTEASPKGTRAPSRKKSLPKPLSKATGNGHAAKTIIGEVTEAAAADQMREELRRREEQLRFITDHAPVMIAHCDRELRYLFVNKPYAERLGMEPHELIGRSILEVLGPSALEAIRPYCAKVLAGETVRFETQIPYERIGRRYMHVHYVPERDAQGAVQSFVAAITDITEKRESDLLLRRQAEVLEQTHDAIVIWEVGGGIHSWNRGAERLYGFSEAEALRHVSHELLRTGLPCAADEFEKRLLQERTWSGELHQFTKDGRRLTVESRMSLYEAEEGRRFVIETNRDISLRRKAEEAMRESQQRFRNMADHSPVMVWVTEADGSCSYLNQRWYEFTGQATEEALGFGWLKAVHPDDLAATEGAFHSANRAHSPFRMEYRLRRRDGQYCWAIDAAAPRFDTSGAFLGYIGSVIDISERKQAEDALRETQAQLRQSEQQLRAITDSTPALISLIDAHGCYEFVNHQYEVWFSRPATEILGRHVNEVLGEEAMTRLRPHMERALKGETVRFESQVHYKGAGDRWVDVSYVPRRDSHDEVNGFFVLVTDIGERKKIEEELRQSESRYRALMEQARDGILVGDRNGKLLLANTSAQAMLGYTKDEIESLHIADTYAPEDKQELGERMRQLQAGQHLIFSRKMRRKDGSFFDAELSVGMLLNGLCHATARDISERRRTEILLDAQKRSLEMVVTGAPLDTVLTYLTQVVEQQAQGQVVASILLLDRGGRLHNGASPGLPPDYLKAIDGLPADKSVGTCCAAAATGEAVLTPDFNCDPKWRDYKHLPQGIGFRGAWSQPILARDGSVLGTFGTYFRECREPSPSERQSVEILARTAALAIERARDETALRESEQLYRAIGESIDYGIWVCGADGRNTYTSESFLKLLGITQEECSNLGWGNLLHPDDAEATLAAWKECARQGGFWEREHRFKGADGKYHPILARGVPIRNDRGEITCWAGINLDIDALKKKEADLRESRERLQASLRAAEAGTFRWNMRTDTLEFDEALNRLFGLPQHRACMDFDEMLPAIHPDDRADFLARCHQCVATGADFEMEYRVVWPDGSVRWIDDRGKTFFDAEGKPEYMTGACVDITERKATEEVVEQSRERLNFALKAADMGVWFCDLPFDELNWDAKVKEHFWLPTDAPVSIQTFFDRMHPDDRERTQRAIEYSINHRASYSCDYRTVSPGGEVKWIRALGRCFYDTGKPTRFDGVTLDITDMVKARETLTERRAELERLVDERTASLRQAIAQMEEFSYSVSHDLRAPLRAMKGYSSVLLDDYAKQLDPQGRIYLERIGRAAERMDKLTQDVLTLSRLARADMPLNTVPLSTVVHDVIAQYPGLQSSSAEIVVGPLHEVRGHEPSLAQALSNLLGNAVKFVARDRKPRVEVFSEERDGKVRLHIRDNGIGIKPEHQARLFGMFERVHPDRNYEGTGIGLAIVRKAIERMGGTVGVHSDGATGCTFWVELAKG